MYGTETEARAAALDAQKDLAMPTGLVQQVSMKDLMPRGRSIYSQLHVSWRAASPKASRTSERCRGTLKSFAKMFLTVFLLACIALLSE